MYYQYLRRKKIVTLLTALLSDYIQRGVLTSRDELDDFVYEYCEEHKLLPAEFAYITEAVVASLKRDGFEDLLDGFYFNREISEN